MRSTPVLSVHAVGLRAALLATLIAGVVCATRLPGIATPPGMFFDEILYARAAAEYVAGREPGEWTHPPLAKEVIAVSLGLLARFRVQGSAPAPAGFGEGPVAQSGSVIAWATDDGLRSGRLAGGCGVSDVSVLAAASESTAIAVSGRRVVVGSAAGEVRSLEVGNVGWSARLPAAVTGLALVGRSTFAVDGTGSLWLIAPDGTAGRVAEGAGRIWAVPEDLAVWVTFPQTGSVSWLRPDGTERSRFPALHGDGPLVVPAHQTFGDVPHAIAVLVADPGAGVIRQANTAIDERRSLAVAARLLSTQRGGLVWAAEGDRLTVIEPRGMSAIGGVRLPAEVSVLVPDGTRPRVLAGAGDRVWCLGGDAAFAWRLPSAVMGGLVVALTFLIAMRVFGRVSAGLVAAALVSLDGMTFTLSRIAQTDIFLTAFILVAWFCALSALRAVAADGRGAVGWIAGCAVAGGAATATKWSGAWAFAGTAALLVWGLGRGRNGRLSWLGPVLGLMAALSAAVYLASYTPFLRRHGLGELVDLHARMLGFQTSEEPLIWLSSPWYRWPTGALAVRLAGRVEGALRGETWLVPNAVVTVGGLAGLAVLALRGRLRRDAILLVPAGAMLVQYLPWALVPRATFVYHFLPSIPFLAIGLAGAGAVDSRALRIAFGVITVVAAAALFVYALPLSAGIPVSTERLLEVKQALSWMFP